MPANLDPLNFGFVEYLLGLSPDSAVAVQTGTQLAAENNFIWPPMPEPISPAELLDIPRTASEYNDLMMLYPRAEFEPAIATPTIRGANAARPTQVWYDEVEPATTTIRINNVGVLTMVRSLPPLTQELLDTLTPHQIAVRDIIKNTVRYRRREVLSYFLARKGSTHAESYRAVSLPMAEDKCQRSEQIKALKTLGECFSKYKNVESLYVNLRLNGNHAAAAKMIDELAIARSNVETVMRYNVRNSFGYIPYSMQNRMLANSRLDVQSLCNFRDAPRGLNDVDGLFNDLPYEVRMLMPALHCPSQALHADGTTDGGTVSYYRTESDFLWDKRTYTSVEKYLTDTCNQALSAHEIKDFGLQIRGKTSFTLAYVENTNPQGWVDVYRNCNAHSCMSGSDAIKVYARKDNGLRLAYLTNGSGKIVARAIVRDAANGFTETGYIRVYPSPNDYIEGRALRSMLETEGYKTQCSFEGVLVNKVEATDDVFWMPYLDNGAAEKMNAEFLPMQDALMLCRDGSLCGKQTCGYTAEDISLAHNYAGEDN
jgi:hypothetical protein